MWVSLMLLSIAFLLCIKQVSSHVPFARCALISSIAASIHLSASGQDLASMSDFGSRSLDVWKAKSMASSRVIDAVFVILLDSTALFEDDMICLAFGS